jgi:acid phosphatase
MKNFIRGFILLFLLVLTGCSSTAPALKIMNLGAAKNAVQGYYESGEFDRECSKIIDDAISHLNSEKVTNRSAVVFDIDETALSNYEQTKSIGFGYINKMWIDYIQQAKAPAIKETKRFYDYLVSRNIHVIFLTGRTEDLYEATKRNLIGQGYTLFDTLIVRSAAERKIPAAEFKTLKREELVKKGYDIIACIGDQWSDLVGGNTGYKIKLPNYLYLID